MTALHSVTHDQCLQNLSMRSHLAWWDTFLSRLAKIILSRLQVCKAAGMRGCCPRGLELKQPSFSGNWEP